MKKLTIITLFFVGIAAFMTSCNLDNVSPFSLGGDSDSLDLLALASTGDSTASDTTHHRHGKHKVTEIEVSALPAAITSYISTNYAGATIDRAGTLEDGSYVVKITKADATSVGLKFDSAGAFVAEKTPKAKPTHIAVADLPAAITAYITTNYAGATIKHAVQHADGTYGVLVQKADNTMVGVGFDAAGNFTAEMTPREKGNGKKKGPKKG